MDQVIGIIVVETNTGYRFKTGWFGKQILQVSDICQSWDTNMGCNVGPEFLSWRNATKKEADDTFLKKLSKVQSEIIVTMEDLCNNADDTIFITDSETMFERLCFIYKTAGGEIGNLKKIWPQYF